MRSVEASLTLPAPRSQVWKRVSTTGGWERLARAFAGWGSRVGCAVLQGSGDAAREGLELEVRSAAGRPLLRARVSAFEPPGRIEWTLTREGSRLGSFHLLLSCRLQETGGDSTRVELGMMLLFSSRLLEIASLLIPIRFFYRRRLARALETLREPASTPA